jgi:hypothetical protein
MRLCRECAKKASSCLILFLRYTTIHWEETTWDATAKPLPPNCDTAYLNYIVLCYHDHDVYTLCISGIHCHRRPTRQFRLARILVNRTPPKQAINTLRRKALS